MKNKWQAVRFGNDKYGVFHRGHNGEIEYSNRQGTRYEFDDFFGAQSWADKLNGDTPLLRKCSETEFHVMSAHVSLGVPIRSALKSILVDGKTWKQSAETYGVSESGILRAMRRVSEANHA